MIPELWCDSINRYKIKISDLKFDILKKHKK